MIQKYDQFNLLSINIGIFINAFKFVTEALNSRIFAGFPPDLFKALSEEALTGNFHHYGVTEQVQMSNYHLCVHLVFNYVSDNSANIGL